MRWIRPLAVVLTAVLVLSACDSDDDGSSQNGDVSRSDARDLAGDTAVEPVDDIDAAEPETDAGQDTAPGDVAEEIPCTLCGGECGAGMNCVPAGPMESLVCRPVGTTPVGQPCNAGSATSCVAGADCVPYDSETAFCRALCSPSDSGCGCASGDQVCIPWFGPSGTTAGICLGGECTLPSSGCPDQQRCTVLLDQVLACVPVGSVPPGGDCSADDCQVGSICRSVDGDLRCREFCLNASDCAGADTHCAWRWPDLTSYGFCRPGCDPILGEGCLESEGCYYMDPDEGETDCWTSGTLAEGADCSSFAELCVPGTDCVLEPSTDPFEYYCRAYCDDEHPCESPQQCTQIEALGALKICL